MKKISWDAFSAGILAILLGFVFIWNLDLRNQLKTQIGLTAQAEESFAIEKHNFDGAFDEANDALVIIHQYKLDMQRCLTALKGI